MRIADGGLRIGKRRQQTEHEVGLIEEAERLQTFGFGGGAQAGEVDVRGDVLIARLLQPRGAAAFARALTPKWDGVNCLCAPMLTLFTV